MAIWVLRSVLVSLGGLAGAIALEVEPRWVPNLGIPRTFVGLLAILSAGVTMATFARQAQARTLAVVTGWTLCLGALAMLIPAIIAHV